MTRVSKQTILNMNNPRTFVRRHDALQNLELDWVDDKIVITGLSYILNSGKKGVATRELLDYICGASFMNECDNMATEMRLKVAGYYINGTPTNLENWVDKDKE